MSGYFKQPLTTMAALTFLRSLQIASISIGIAFGESSLASIQRDGEACFAIASAIPQLKTLAGNRSIARPKILSNKRWSR
jgi:hypothetical protein